MSEATQPEGIAGPSIRSNEFFETHWRIYQKVLNNNYMGHREISNVLQEFLASYFHEPFSLLDLGCGDSSFTARSLSNSAIAYYRGIDLSHAALEIARNNISLLPCTSIFTHGDFYKIIW